MNVIDALKVLLHEAVVDFKAQDDAATRAAIEECLQVRWQTE